MVFLGSGNAGQKEKLESEVLTIPIGTGNRYDVPGNLLCVRERMCVTMCFRARVSVHLSVCILSLSLFVWLCSVSRSLCACV